MQAPALSAQVEAKRRRESDSREQENWGVIDCGKTRGNRWTDCEPRQVGMARVRENDSIQVQLHWPEK